MGVRGGGSLFCFVREGVLYFVFCRVGGGGGDSSILCHAGYRTGWKN